jgi:hypothetical protein
VSATAGQAADQHDLAERLGVKPGHVVQEIGYDDDCDEQLRDSVAAGEDVELVDEDYDDVVDGVLLWWRDDDGDLVDALVDAKTPLADGGYVLLLTPKAGRDGHVEPSEIGEAAPTAGLSQTSTVSAGKNWSATRLVAPKSRALTSRAAPAAPGGAASSRAGGRLVSFSRGRDTRCSSAHFARTQRCLAAIAARSGERIP